jgi:hypothetical protein
MLAVTVETLMVIDIASMSFDVERVFKRICNCQWAFHTAIPHYAESMPSPSKFEE